jgi:hypothetical protein
MSFVPTRRGDHLSFRYLRWKLLESGRTLQQQIELRHVDASRRIAALVDLGVYAHQEFTLSGSNQGPSEPDWLLKLTDQAMQEVIYNKADWPDIRIDRSSNSLLVSITAPVPLVERFQKALQEHGGEH